MCASLNSLRGVIRLFMKMGSHWLISLYIYIYILVLHYITIEMIKCLICGNSARITYNNVKCLISMKLVTWLDLVAKRGVTSLFSFVRAKQSFMSVVYHSCVKDTSITAVFKFAVRKWAIRIGTVIPFQTYLPVHCLGLVGVRRCTL